MSKDYVCTDSNLNCSHDNTCSNKCSNTNTCTNTKTEYHSIIERFSLKQKCEVGEWHPWYNCWCYVTVTVFGNIFVFVAIYFLHELKAKNVHPYKGPDKHLENEKEH
jgi:hypothetical protein